MKKWLPVISKEGIMFFFDKSTGSCQWTYPKEYDSKTKKYENIFFKDWIKLKDNNNKNYWKNSKNGIIQYIKPSSTTFILEAALLDNFAFIELYFEYNGDINFKDNEERNSLHYACMNDNDKMVKLLIKLGCEINKSDNMGNTPLIYSIMYHSYKSLKILIEFGADLNKKNKNGNSILHYAVKNKNQKVILFLIKNGCEIGEKNKQGEYPIDWAVKDNNWSLVNMLTKLSNVIYTEKNYQNNKDNSSSSDSDNEINTNKKVNDENKKVNLDFFDNNFSPIIFESRRNSKVINQKINNKLIHLNINKDNFKSKNKSKENLINPKLSIDDINFSRKEDDEEDLKEGNEQKNNIPLILKNKNNNLEKEDNKSIDSDNKINNLNEEKNVNISFLNEDKNMNENYFNEDKNINLSILNQEKNMIDLNQGKNNNISNINLEKTLEFPNLNIVKKKIKYDNIISTSISKKIKNKKLLNTDRKNNIDNSIISNATTLNTTNVSKISQVSSYITTNIYPKIKSTSEKIIDYLSLLYNKLNVCSRKHTQKIYRNLNKLYNNLYIYYFNPPDIENQIEYLRYSIQLDSIFKKNNNNNNNIVNFKNIKFSLDKKSYKKKRIHTNPYQQREFNKYNRIKKKRKKYFIYSIPKYMFFNLITGNFNKKKLKCFTKHYDSKFIKILFSSPIIKNQLYKLRNLNKNDLLLTSFNESKLEESIKYDTIMTHHIRSLTQTLNSINENNEINTNTKNLIPKLNLTFKNLNNKESDKDEEEEDEKEEKQIISTNRSTNSAYEHIFKSLNNINKIIDYTASQSIKKEKTINDKKEENWDNLEVSLMNNNHNNSTITYNNDECDLENILKEYNFQLNMLKQRENEKMENSISISSSFFSIIDKK